MPNGWDPVQGHILVPFDLKRDVVEPLEKLQVDFADMNKKLDEHLAQVEVSIKTKMGPMGEWIEKEMQEQKEARERRAQAKKIFWWSIAIGGPIILAAIGKIVGLPI